MDKGWGGPLTNTGASDSLRSLSLLHCDHKYNRNTLGSSNSPTPF